MYRLLLVILAVLVCLLALAFHLKNAHMVELNYFLGSFEYHFSVFIIGGIILGILLGVLASLPGMLSLKRQNSRLNKQMQIKDKEVNNLRALPIKDSH